MNRTEQAVEHLRQGGFEAQAIADALCDGVALEAMGLGDDDKEDIEAEAQRIKQVKAKAYKEKVLDRIVKEKPDINEAALTLSNKLGEMLIKTMMIWKERDHLSDFMRQALIDPIDDLYELVHKGEA